MVITTSHEDYRPCDKSDYQCLLPFVIPTWINEVTIHLYLPSHIRLHLVFYGACSIRAIFQIMWYHAPHIPSHYLCFNLLMNPDWEIAIILDSKVICSELSYFVDWLGCTLSDWTWEPSENSCQGIPSYYVNKANPLSLVDHGTCRIRRGVVLLLQYHIEIWTHGVEEHALIFQIVCHPHSHHLRLNLLMDSKMKLQLYFTIWLYGINLII